MINFSMYISINKWGNKLLIFMSMYKEMLYHQKKLGSN